MAPPSSIMSNVSARNCSLICCFLAPRARRRPISRMRSSTETSMMFITPTPPIPSVSVPINVSSTCRPMVSASMIGRNSSRPNIWMAFLSVLLPCCHRRQHLCHSLLFKLRCNGFKHHHRGVARVPEITRRRIRDPYRLVFTREIIAQLDLALHHADHGEAHAANQDGLAHRRSSAEQLLTQTPAQEAHAPPFQFVTGIDPASFRRHFVAHLAVFGTHAAYGSSPHHPVAVRDSRTPDCLQTDVLHQRRVLLHHLQVSLLQHNLLAGALATRLLAGLLRPADDHALA